MHMYAIVVFHSTKELKMPNHCYQTVDIKGDAMSVTELYYALTEQDRFCDFVIPMPIEMREGDKWYDWRRENWATKWDLCQVTIIETDDEGFLTLKALLPETGIVWSRVVGDKVMIKLNDDIDIEWVEKQLNSLHRTLSLMG